MWNTIGLNKCPAAWWNAFDAGDLAKELGDTLVLLNGPRHFLMDSVTASPGRVRAFHGRRLRKVAAIPIRTAADLARAPTRRLTHELALGANGTATIVQDELQNTYQLASSSRAPGGRERHAGGRVDMRFTIEGGEIDFRGTARFTAGTGAYRGITSGALQVHDHNTLDGQNGVVSVQGAARY